MYPLAPVRRIREVPGVAAGFAVDVLRPVSDLCTSDLSSRLGPGEGAITPLPGFDYFFFMVFWISSRVARYSWFPGSEANAFSIAAMASAFFSAPMATSA
jgi:hypothetical protein